MGIREKGLKLPLRVDFAITGNCNLRCKHCSAASTWEIDKSKELSTEEIKGTFRYFSEIGIFKIFLFGGEPFFHPDICEILEYASGFKFQFTTSTNGTLLTRDFVKFLKELGIFKRVQVSLDGPNAQIHDALRGAGVFERTVQGIKNLLAVGINVNIRTTVCKLNYLHLKEISYFVKNELGLSDLGFGETIFGGAACKNDYQLVLTPQERYQTIKIVWELQEEEKDMGFSENFVQVADMLKAYFKAEPHSGKRGKFGTCGITRTMIGLRSDGEIVPCSAFWDYPMGNIRNCDLGEVWKKSGGMEALYAIADKKLEEYEKCRDCDYVTFCNAGCRAVAFYDSGRINGFSKHICETFAGKKEEVMARFNAA